MTTTTAYCAGIDLGTTNTVLSVWTRGAAAPEIVPIGQPVSDVTPAGFDRLPLLDSAVTLLDNRVWVGAFARQMALARGACCFASIKRYMGRHWFRTRGGLCWTPERVSACILRVVRDELLARFGALPERVVVTIPASFGTEARRATLAAARMAGFPAQNLSLFDEPTAALLAQLRDEGEVRPAAGNDLHAVVDIGGGTLDVSLVRLGHHEGRTVFDVVGQSRYNEIAGDDFDINIAGLLLHRFEERFGPIRRVFGSDTERVLLCWSLLQSAREVKHRLSDRLATSPPSRWASISDSVTVSEFPGLDPWRSEVSGADLVDALREYFPAVADPDARRSEFGFFQPIQECLDTASVHEGTKLGPFDVSQVWMAGGSASLPPVKLALRHIFRSNPQMIRGPMFAIARGAAWKSGIDEGYGDGQFEVRERVFDGIFIRTRPGQFEALVPARQEVPMPTTPFPDLLRMPRPDNRLMLELYTGRPPVRGENNPEFAPLARRVVTFREFLPGGTNISLDAELTSDGELRLELFADAGRTVRGEVTVGTAPGWEDAGEQAELPPINEPAVDP